MKQRDVPKLWLVRRSANARTHHGPRLYWLAIAVNGPKQVTLVKPYCGRIAFKRSCGRSVRDGGQRTALYWRWLNILAEVWS